MPPLMQLPAYQYPQNALLNFAPINEAIDANRQNALATRKLDQGDEHLGLERRKVDMAGAQHDFAMQQAKVDDFGRVAQAINETKDPAVRQQLITLAQGKHGDLINHAVEKGADVNHPQFWGAMAFHSKNYDPQKDEVQRAQAGNLNSQAVLHRAQAGAYNALARQRSGPDQPPADPTAGWGQDRDGNLVRSQSEVKGESQDQPPTVSMSHRDFGPAGVGSKSIPGIVVDESGNGGTKANAFATRQAQGQRALDEQPEAMRQRFIQSQQERAAREAAYGKAPSGKAWSADGRLTDLSTRESVTDRQSIAIAQEGLKALDYAEAALTGKDGKPATTSAIGQAFGDEYHLPGGMKVGGFGEAGRAFKSAKAAVLDLNFAISGKSVSNAEREAFLGIYMPTAYDSLETQKWKMSRVRSFFNTALAARKSGASDDEIAGLYRSAISQGERGPEQQKQGGSQAPAAPKANPAADKYINKYGLE